MQLSDGCVSLIPCLFADFKRSSDILVGVFKRGLDISVWELSPPTMDGLNALMWGDSQRRRS